MSELGTTIYTVLLGWMRTVNDWFWSVLSGGGETLYRLVLSHWKSWLLAIVVAGLVIDWLIWMIRWRPLRLIFGKKVPVSPEEKERWKDGGLYYAPEEEEEIAPIQHADWTDMTLRTLSEVDPDWAENLALETPEVLETDPPGHDPWAVTPDEMDIDESLDPADSQEVEPDYPYAAAQPPQSWDDTEAQDGAFDAADGPEEPAGYGAARGYWPMQPPISMPEDAYAAEEPEAPQSWDDPEAQDGAFDAADGPEEPAGYGAARGYWPMQPPISMPEDAYAAEEPEAPQSWDDPEVQDGAFDAADEPEEAVGYGVARGYWPMQPPTSMPEDSYAADEPAAPQSWDDPEVQDAFDAADGPEEAVQYGTWPAHYEEAQAVHRRRRSVRESRRAGRSHSMGGEEVQHHQPKHMDARPARLVVPAPEKDWKGTGYAKPLKRKRLLSLSGEEEEAVSGLPPMPVEGAAFHAAAMPDGTRRRQDDEYDSGR